MEKTFTFDMASKAYADYILNRKDRYAPLIVEIPEGIEDIEPLAFDMMPLTSVKFPSTMTEISNGAFGESTLKKWRYQGTSRKYVAVLSVRYLAWKNLFFTRAWRKSARRLSLCVIILKHLL